jgi:small subunit ribosomal protein S2
MIASRQRELRKIRRNLEGIRNMNKLPGALVVVDVHRERNALREAKKLGIPTICLIDTDSDPDFADLPIPGNDDAMRAIELVLAQLVDAVEIGLKSHQDTPPPEEGAPPRRRSRRPAAGRADEAPPADVPPEASTEAAGGGPSGLGAPSGDSGTDLTTAAASEPEVSS